MPRTPPIRIAAPPPDSLIAAYAVRSGLYADAFHASVSGSVTLAAYLKAFYGSRLFAAERAVLRLAGHASTANAVEALAQGRADSLAAWMVETRRPDEILLRDVSGRTGSWLGAQPDGVRTRLWFGSVILPPARRPQDGIGPLFAALIGPHRLYSRALLRAAIRNLPEG